jgi:hypothetical protein
VSEHHGAVFTYSPVAPRIMRSVFSWAKDILAMVGLRISRRLLSAQCSALHYETAASCVGFRGDHPLSSKLKQQRLPACFR